MRSFEVRFRLEGTKPILMGFATNEQVMELARRELGSRERVIVLPPREPPVEAQVDTEERARLKKLRGRALAKYPDALVLPDLKSEREPVLQELAIARLYTDGGTIGLPSHALFACLREAGKGIKVGRRKVSVGSVRTPGSTVLPAFVDVETSFFPFEHSGWNAHYCFLKPHELRLRRADYRVVVFPRFDEWAIEGTLVVRMHMGFTLEHTVELVRLAGENVGLGSMRGERKGYVNFGSFRVACFEVVREFDEHRPIFEEVERSLDAPPSFAP